MKSSIRSCVACRVREEKTKLQRLVYINGQLLWDKEKKAQARGAYVHLKLGCLSLGAGKMPLMAKLEKAMRLKAGTITAQDLKLLLAELIERELSERCV